MKPMFKLTLLIVLSIVLVVPNFAAADGKDNKISTIDAKLQSIGTPPELIDLLSPEMKRKLAKDSIEFISYKTVTGIDNDNMDESDFTTLTIPDNEFEFTTMTFRQSNVNNRERFSVGIVSHWLPNEMPIWRLTDPYGAAFDGDVFRLVAGTAYYENLFRWDNGDLWTTLSTGTNFGYTAANGAGFNATLKDDSLTNFIYEQQNSAVFTIESKTTGSISGSSQIQANYYHTWGGGSIGLTFGVFSVSFSGGASTDSRGTVWSFNY